MSYALAMTDLLERALVAARDLPAEMQGEVTRLVLACAGDDTPAIPPSGTETARAARRGPAIDAPDAR